MTVEQLLAILSLVDPATPVRCTWEGIRPEIAGIYWDREGGLLIDCDNGFYLEDYLKPGTTPLYIGEV